MVTLYIPLHRRVSDMVARLSSEITEAGNIQSRTTRKDVTAYGLSSVVEAIGQGRVSRLLVSEELPNAIELSQSAEDKGATVTIISTVTEEGGILWKGFGGVGAILRY